MLAATALEKRKDEWLRQNGRTATLLMLFVSRPETEEMMMMNERPIPEAALRDQDAVEMLRVWIAEKKLHCSMKVGIYRETMNVPEEKAWGTILADVARHLANALESGYASNAAESLQRSVTVSSRS